MRRAQLILILLAFGFLGVAPNPTPDGTPTGLDHLLHFVGWTVGAISGRYAYPKAHPMLVAGLLFLYSFVIELIQILVPGRSFELMDLVANAGGLLLGLVIYRVLARVEI